MPKTTTVPVLRPALPRWVMAGVAGCGGLMLSLVASANHVSPLWVIPVTLVLADYTARRWVRRKYDNVTAKPCPGCGKPPAMMLVEDGDAIHIRVWCSTRAKCRTTGGVEVRATINTEANAPRGSAAVRVPARRRWVERGRHANHFAPTGA